MWNSIQMFQKMMFSMIFHIRDRIFVRSKKVFFSKCNCFFIQLENKIDAHYFEFLCKILIDFVVSCFIINVIFFDLWSVKPEYIWAKTPLCSYRRRGARWENISFALDFGLTLKIIIIPKYFCLFSVKITTW